MPKEREKGMCKSRMKRYNDAFFALAWAMETYQEVIVVFILIVMR